MALTQRVFKRLSSTKTSGFVHEYSIKPTTFNFRLPSPTDTTTYTTFNKNSPFAPIFNNLSNDPIHGYSVQEYFDLFPLLNSKKLSHYKERPKRVKMLAGDFIEDSLYNPNYGYFSKQVEIFQTESPFDYQKLKNSNQFIESWLKQYSRYSNSNKNLQLWHTPTELFQPFYGEAIARYLLVNYKLNLYPYSDLVIYEIGGGNGTLMMNILNFIKENQPEVYKMTQYRIIEISKTLSDKQRINSLRLKMLEHHDQDRFQIINKSILDWDEYIPEPCFVLGLEVLDNLSHDVVKYDIKTGDPYQGYVVIDDKGDFYQFFSPDLEEWTKNFLQQRPILDDVDHPLNEKFLPLKNFVSPFKNSLTSSEFIPTRLLKFFNVLNTKFPEHQLVLSDFDSLSKRSEGYNSPVVQTMINNDKMITASTYMVHQGFFDIMFPTNFELIKNLYIKTCGRLIKTSKHDEFLSNWADLDETTTQNGENPMLSFYSNATFLHS